MPRAYIQLAPGESGCRARSPGDGINRCAPAPGRDFDAFDDAVRAMRILPLPGAVSTPSPTRQRLIAIIISPVERAKHFDFYDVMLLSMPARPKATRFTTAVALNVPMPPPARVGRPVPLVRFATP